MYNIKLPRNSAIYTANLVPSGLDVYYAETS